MVAVLEDRASWPKPDPTLSLRIIGTRNGSFGGQLVLARDEEFSLGRVAVTDRRPPTNTLEMFNRIAPNIKWVTHAHTAPNELCDNVQVGYAVCDCCFGCKRGASMESGSHFGWKEPRQVVVFPRLGANVMMIKPHLHPGAPLGVHRAVGEVALLHGMRGFGRLGADFWPVVRGARSDSQVIGRYPETSWGQFALTAATPAILAPGTVGATSTVRFENLCEGLQEAEARVFLEQALTSSDVRARLGEELVRQCRRVLQDRLDPLIAAAKPQEQGKGWHWYAAKSGWQDRVKPTFEAVAAVVRLHSTGGNRQG